MRLVAMAATSVCTDTSDAEELHEAQGLWLKPIARINVSVQLPQLRTPGKSISNWEVRRVCVCVCVCVCGGESTECASWRETKKVCLWLPWFCWEKECPSLVHKR